MSSLKVSALIPTYNRRPYVCRAIDSVLAQTVPVDEIVVVDDGSTDGTAEAIRIRYGSRIKVIQEENGGVSVARRRAIEESRGQWVAFLDSDDEWVPDRNAAFLNAVSIAPQTVAWIFGDTQFVRDENSANSTIFGENGLVIRSDVQVFHAPYSELVWDSARPRACLLQSSFIQKRALLELNCFSEGLRHSEDLLASLQIASRYSFAAIPHIVTKLYRTIDLDNTSLEYGGRSSIDHYRATVRGYALAARTAGVNPWAALHAEAVRGLCKSRACEGLAIRRLALDQFIFGVSTQSIAFFCAAMLGSRFIRCGMAAKHKLRKLRSAVTRQKTDPRISA